MEASNKKVKILIKGFNCVTIMNRGIECELSTPVYHNAINYDDFVEVIQHVKNKNPDNLIYGVGVSLGSNYMINMVANHPDLF